MSMELMVLAMKTHVGSHARKLVLIKLADNACDKGECWPSYQHIADQCEMSKRSAMRHIDKLVEDGLIRKEVRKGGIKGNRSNVYFLEREMLLSSMIQPTTPSDKLSLGVVSESHPPSDTVTPPPSDIVSPRTSHSLDPVKEPIKNKSKNLDFSVWPEMPSNQTLNDWLAMRKRMKADVTQTVINRLAPQLTIAFNKGVSVDDCLGECVVRNWRGFEFDWLSDEIKARGLGRLRANQRRSSDFELSGQITNHSSRKDVSLALQAGMPFKALPERHQNDLIGEWRAGRLRIELVSLLEKQNVLL
ncbi:helix-turn-helix domain-containing protein [Pseudoalteromonas sp. S2755]|nr:helix-turn-helix domain-containing protein [Pseudoalteromonas sp. S2755]